MQYMIKYTLFLGSTDVNHILGLSPHQEQGAAWSLDPLLNHLPSSETAGQGSRRYFR